MCCIKTIYISITSCLTTCFPLWFKFFFLQFVICFSEFFFYRYPEDLIIKSTKSISVCRGSYYGRPGKVSVPFKARNVIHDLVVLPVWIIRFILFIIVFSFAVIIKKDVVIVSAKSIWAIIFFCVWITPLLLSCCLFQICSRRSRLLAKNSYLL